MQLSAGRFANPLWVVLAFAFCAATIGATLTRAGGEERTISFFHIHTKETLTVTYKRDGTYIPEALEKIDWVMRDWRKNKSTKMDPKTVDIIWEMHRELGSKEPVHIICGYRSRETNNMLRRSVGGQASQSEHITGRAIDFMFPDVPVRRLRYAAMTRERGGVGYYPTSGVPFVHVDTARVRHWPRMGRDELALIFPSGRSQHEPTDGRPISPRDVAAARAKSQNASLVAEVAAYFDLKSSPPRDTAVAMVDPSLPKAPEPKPAARPVVASQSLSGAPRMGIGAPPAGAEERQAVAALPPQAEPTMPQPKLVSAPKPLDRPSRFTPAVAKADRQKLDQLVTLASLDVSPPSPAPAKRAPSVVAEPKSAPQVAEPNPLALGAQRSAWITAPDFDEDHPEEMSYRPFPLAPLLTETSSFDDPALAVLQHPDADKAAELMDEDGLILPMSMGPGQQAASMLWAQEFSGDPVHRAALAGSQPAAAGKAGQIASRSVKTLPR